MRDRAKTYEVQMETFATAPGVAVQGRRRVEGWAIKWWVPVETVPPTLAAPGSWRKTIADKAQFSRMKLLWQHQPEAVIGKILSLDERPEGLWMVAELATGTQLADEALVLIKQGVIDSFSVGFDPVVTETVSIADLPKLAGSAKAVSAAAAHYMAAGITSCRVLKEVRGWEVSLVTFAACSPAKVKRVFKTAPQLRREREAVAAKRIAAINAALLDGIK
jgi:HK97 family phage prohead protease